MSRIRVLLADDHEEVLDGAEAILEESFDITLRKRPRQIDTVIALRVGAPISAMSGGYRGARSSACVLPAAPETAQPALLRQSTMSQRMIDSRSTTRTFARPAWYGFRKSTRSE